MNAQIEKCHTASASPLAFIIKEPSIPSKPRVTMQDKRKQLSRSHFARKRKSHAVDCH